ncbi:helix-turn-helix domain-containing protein [Actinosynnema sp. NPDC020468]|uniref:TetR/AcrR family transcriptional regulator n=1 Tax=Actinosynnema sp. NPDC020468 TaxID=3154488 RepID=UPI0033EE1DEB
MPDNGPRLARRPVRADGRRNYDAILEVARETFAAEGTGASVEEVARRAGVAIGTLYGHFPTREALVEASLRDGLTALLEAGAHAADTLPPLPALVDWLHRAVEYCGTYRGAVTLLTRSVDDEQSYWHAGCAAMEQCAETLLRTAQAAGRVRADVEPRDVVDVISAAAWVRENSGPRTGPSRLLDLFLTGVTTA